MAELILELKREKASARSWRKAPESPRVSSGEPSKAWKSHLDKYNTRCYIWLNLTSTGGVFKKRLSKNMYRSIVLAKGQKTWIFAYLFAKQDRANIDAKELKEFRKLANLYAGKTDADLRREVKIGELMEIWHGN